MKQKYKKVGLIIIIMSILGITITTLHAKNNISIKDTNEELTIEQSREVTSFNIQPDNRTEIKQPQLTTTYIITIGFFIITLSLSLIYLLMKHKYPKFYQNKDKLTIYILSNIILATTLTIITILLINKLLLNNNLDSRNQITTKDKVILDESNQITEGMIDLSKQNTDVTIKNGGSYTFTGSFAHSIIVDSEEEVEIILNKVEINNDKTATIIGLSESKITITLATNSENFLSDGGNSEYDGCIFSNSPLIFNGSGTLTINGNQLEGEGIATESQNITFENGTYLITSNDDGINAGGDGGTITINDGTFYIDANGDGIDSNKNAIINGGTIFVIGSDTAPDSGIDTEDGFEINGGTVIALASDMIEIPLTTSTQKTIAFTLNQSITKNTLVTLMKEDKSIISFESPKKFKTIIISSNLLENGTYTLYTGGAHNGTLNHGIYKNGEYTIGEKITIDNKNTFTITETVNLFGNTIK